jgi:L-ascorbate metabolism protein UlaG (beta-lactamase superfamily)
MQQSKDNSPYIQYKYNPDLLFINEDYKGNMVDKNGLFINEHSPFENSFKKFVTWQKERKTTQKPKKNIQFEAPIKDGNDFFATTQDAILWLGHASFLIRLGNKLMITDPILGSPSFLMKRYSKLPIDINRLINIDYILISHDHRDHVDKRSLQIICKQNPKAIVFTGLSLAPLLAPMVKPCNVIEAGWYQQYLPKHHAIQITYLPARHWGRRNLNDTNKRLWGSFMISNEQKQIYYGADSGYDKHFKNIGNMFPDIDVALLGIGAYKPEWFMEQSHTSPLKALMAANDLGCKHMIPMHYNTFDLSDEFMHEPLEEVNRQYASGDYNFALKPLVIGELVNL